MNAFDITDIQKYFDGVAAIDDLTLSFPKGKIIGIIGPNGSGKTTLINTITGMFPWDSGVLHIGKRTHEKMIAYTIRSYGMTRTFQEVRLFNQMSALDNILVVLSKPNMFQSLIDGRRDDRQQKAQQVLEQVGLWEYRNKNAIHLSYGQKKLLEIARAISIGADIYFFDEPFAGLFPEMIKIVVTIIKQLRGSGKTIILVEHNMELMKELSDEMIVLDSGKLLALGKPQNVLKDKRVIEAYLGE